jgi:hypothetical protein
MINFLHANVNVEITTLIRTHFVLHSHVVCLTSNVFLISSLMSAIVSMLKYYFRVFPFFFCLVILMLNLEFMVNSTWFLCNLPTESL